MHDFYDDELPADWVRCANCGTPLTLDVRERQVLQWCKEGCKMAWDEQRVLKEEEESCES